MSPIEAAVRKAPRNPTHLFDEAAGNPVLKSADIVTFFPGVKADCPYLTQAIKDASNGKFGSSKARVQYILQRQQQLIAFSLTTKKPEQKWQNQSAKPFCKAFIEQAVQNDGRGIEGMFSGAVATPGMSYVQYPDFAKK